MESHLSNITKQMPNGENKLTKLNCCLKLPMLRGSKPCSQLGVWLLQHPASPGWVTEALGGGRGFSRRDSTPYTPQVLSVLLPHFSVSTGSSW